MVGQQILALPVGVRIPAPQYTVIGQELLLPLFFTLFHPLSRAEFAGVAIPEQQGKA